MVVLINVVEILMMSAIISYHNLNFTRVWPKTSIYLWYWFKFDLGLTLSMTFKFYSSVAKG